MSRTDDDAAARARLERIAWGAGSSPADAARARIALADLDREARTRPATPVAPGTGSGRRAVPRRTSPAGPGAGTAPDGSGADPVVPVGPVAPVTSAGPVAPVTSAGPVAPVTSAGPVLAVEPAPATTRAGGGRDDAPGSGDAVPSAAEDGATGDGGRWTGLLSGGRRVVDQARVLLGRVRRTDRTVLWALGSAAVVIGLVAGTGVGLSIGTRGSTEPATAATTPAAGTVTLEQMLDLPQTYADQLPGGIDAPVSLHTTRLVFTNRSLAGDDAATPWNVWAGVGRDRSTICLVASADRLQGTSACYPRDDALHGTVSLSASSLSGTLWLRVVGGAVRGTVTTSPPPLS
jgi:hypothetical protein